LKAELVLSPEQQESLDRLLASPTIARAPRLSKVLRFLLQRLSEGRLDEISEQSIGTEVFGRPDGYNAADDNIVRVSVRHLRERLETFYRTEGRDESWIVEIPKGRYIPVLRSRDVALPVQLVAETPVRAGARSKWPWVLMLTGLFCTLLAFQLLRSSARSATPRPPLSGLVQELFLHTPERLSLVLADSNLQAFREVFHKTVPLSEYVDRSYLARQPANLRSQEIWNIVSQRKDTMLASALVAARLQQSLGPLRLNLRHPCDLSTRDFQRDNSILLGGPWIDPWAQLFEDRLNFRIVPPPGRPSGSEIVNELPVGREPKIFAVQRDDAFSIAHARIAVLPNLGDNGKVILVGANSDEAQEAGGDFLVKPESLARLLHVFEVSSAANLPSFELVLEVKSVQRMPRTVGRSAIKSASCNGPQSGLSSPVRIDSRGYRYARCGDDWRSHVFFVKASTVIGWHRKGFRLFWAWKILSDTLGRPAVPKEIRESIRTMSRDMACSTNSRRVAQAGCRHR
jgi:hypothetical protein